MSSSPWMSSIVSFDLYLMFWVGLVEDWWGCYPLKFYFGLLIGVDSLGFMGVLDLLRVLLGRIVLGRWGKCMELMGY